MRGSWLRSGALAAAGTLVLAAASFPAQARDDRLLLNIAGALATGEARDRLDDTIEFYWGDQAYPEPEQRFGIFDTGRKTYALNKTDLQACDQSFLLALVALRDRAKSVGANAVVNIKSIYKNREFRSDTQYECRAGSLVTSVALEGRIVRLPSGPREPGRPHAESPPNH